jgi:hypothetical protein
VFDHTLLLLLVLMIATLLLFLLSFSLSLAFETQEEHSAREEDDRMGDGRCGCVREERENDQHKRDGRRERRGEKSAAKIWKSGKRTDAGVLLFAFFSSSFFCFLVLSSPSEVLLFLKKARVFLLLFCAYQTQDIKTPRRFVAIP